LKNTRIIFKKMSSTISDEPNPTMYKRMKTLFTSVLSPLTVALLVLIATRSVDRVIFTRLAISYSNYLWFLANLILPVAFLVISWPIVWYKMLFTKDITPEMKAFPQYKFLIMGLLDTLYNLLSTFPQPKLGGDLSNVMSQVVLPFNMIGSMIFLGTRYKKCHWIGSTLVIYGVMVNLLPFFEGNKSHKDGGHPDTYDPSVFWIGLSIFSMVFAAASNIYKEIGLKDADLDVWYANAWIGLYQLLSGAFTIWTISVPAFQDPAIHLSMLPKYLANALKCFFGYEVNNTITGDLELCTGNVALTFLFFIVFNIVYNMLMLYIFKGGSSVLFVVSSAVCLPLADLLYNIPLIAGSAYEAFTIYDGFALFVLVMAILTYYSEKEVRVTQDSITHELKSEKKTPMFSTPSTERQHRSSRGRKLHDSLKPLLERRKSAGEKNGEFHV
jgi:uncharacterized membrane protein